MVEGQDIPSSLWEVTFNVSLGNTQHSQSLVSQARDNSDEHYNMVKKKKTGANTGPSFLLQWNQTGCIMQRQMFQTLQLCGEIHDLSVTASFDVYTENNK